MSYEEDFIAAYVDCALWSESIGEEFGEANDMPGDVSLESWGFTPEDLSEEAMASIREDCEDFIRNTPEVTELTPVQAGHDFWLTRNRHGAGFWDRGLGKLGDRLTDAAHAYGESGLYIGDDERIHVA